MSWLTRSQYEEIKKLGRGGFSIVKLVRKNQAQHPDTTGSNHICQHHHQSLFAVKEVDLDDLRHICGSDKELAEKCLAMARDEGKLMMSMQHENIIRVFGFFEEVVLGADTYHLVMEYCDSGDLEQAVQEGELFDEKQIRSWSGQVASALDFLHSNEVVHRDVKTENVFLLAERSVAKLGDFGIAKGLERIGCTNITRVGTLPYSSPEYLRGERYQTPSDAWSYGVLLYRIASLKYPFDLTDRMNYADFERVFQDSNPLEVVPKIYSNDLLQLITGLLNLEAPTRLTLEDVVDHSFFKLSQGKVTKNEPSPKVTKEAAPTKPPNGDAVKRANIALIQAATTGNKANAGSAITQGADINCRDGNNLTPLMISAARGHVMFVEFLLQQGADPLLSDEKGVTALMKAKAAFYAAFDRAYHACKKFGNGIRRRQIGHYDDHYHFEILEQSGTVTKYHTSDRFFPTCRILDEFILKKDPSHKPTDVFSVLNLEFLVC